MKCYTTQSRLGRKKKKGNRKVRPVLRTWRLKLSEAASDKSRDLLWSSERWCWNRFILATKRCQNTSSVRVCKERRELPRALPNLKAFCQRSQLQPPTDPQHCRAANESRAPQNLTHFFVCLEQTVVAQIFVWIIFVLLFLFSISPRETGYLSCGEASRNLRISQVE